MSIRKLTGALLIGIVLALMFLATIAITGTLKGALLAWGTAIVFTAAIAVGFFLLFV